MDHVVGDVGRVDLTRENVESEGVSDFLKSETSGVKGSEGGVGGREEGVLEGGVAGIEEVVESGGQEGVAEAVEAASAEGLPNVQMDGEDNVGGNKDSVNDVDHTVPKSKELKEERKN